MFCATMLSYAADSLSYSGSLLKRGQLLGEKSFPQRRVDHILASGRKESEVGNKRKDAERLQSNEGKPKRKRDGPKWLASSGKVRSLSLSLPLQVGRKEYLLYVY